MFTIGWRGAIMVGRTTQCYFLSLPTANPASVMKMQGSENQPYTNQWDRGKKHVTNQQLGMAEAPLGPDLGKIKFGHFLITPLLFLDCLEA